MMSNNSSVQLHVTFDVGDKYGGIFTYVEISRNLFHIFLCYVYTCGQRSNHVLTTSLKIKDAVRTWYGLVRRGRDVERT